MTFAHIFHTKDDMEKTAEMRSAVLYTAGNVNELRLSSFLVADAINAQLDSLNRDQQKGFKDLTAADATIVSSINDYTGAVASREESDKQQIKEVRKNLKELSKAYESAIRERFAKVNHAEGDE